MIYQLLKVVLVALAVVALAMLVTGNLDHVAVGC